MNAKVTKRPVPTQNKADELRNDDVGLPTDETSKSKKPVKDADEYAAPYPSQADLDAIKAGKFQSRENVADETQAQYQTR